MSLEIVTPTNDDDWRPFDHVIATSFGSVPEERDEEHAARSRALLPYDFRVGIVDGDEVLGGCVSYEVAVSLPGGASVPAAALSSVGVDATKTGRGALRTMMVEHLTRARDRGHAASILNASESSLYRQYGYGAATSIAVYTIDSGRARFAKPLHDDGSLELISDLPSRVADFDDVYQAIAGVVAGTGSRPRVWWEIVVGPKETWLGGGKHLALFHRDVAGSIDGYLIYEVKGGGDWVTNDQVVVHELLATNVTAELRLFQFATSVPLTRSVKWAQAPLDPIVRHHLFDPRQLKLIDAHDLLWLRPLDVARLLSERTYLGDGTVTVEIDDPIFDDQRGPWRIVVGAGTATVEQAAPGSADLTLSPEQLGMVVLGDTRMLDLASAGVLSGPTDVLRTFDRMMTTERRPFNLSKF